MDAIFAGKDRARLAALRAKDPQQSLLERWQRVVSAKPDVAAERLSFVPEIAQHGWAVVAIPDEGFAYTVGLKYRFDQPELLFAAPGLSAEQYASILNVIGAYVAAGNRIDADVPVELAELEITLVFRRYSHAVFGRYPTGFLSTFERYFEDRYHEKGDSLPVIWTELRRRAEGDPPTAAAKKKGAKKAASAASKARSARETSAAKKARSAREESAAKKAGGTKKTSAEKSAKGGAKKSPSSKKGPRTATRRG